ncbi:hypothetical protein BDD12DRAFT_806440 [Trichophaea hybrida]|nr:hypothetical protein BDD12DRAFT_806440 [Trichophaea hybrida]
MKMLTVATKRQQKKVPSTESSLLQPRSHPIAACSDHGRSSRTGLTARRGNSGGLGSYRNHQTNIGGHLRCQWSKFAQREEAGSVNAWECHYEFPDHELWRLELDPESNWKIVHHKSGFLLEEAVVPLLGGNEVVCATKTGDRRKSWVFVLVKDIDRAARLSSSPPTYNANIGVSAAS